jgi:hypothetical protein
MDGVRGHMAELDGAVVTAMHSLMDRGASVGEMDQWMPEQGLDLEQMHRDMTRAGTTAGAMHRSVAAGR